MISSRDLHKLVTILQGQNKLPHLIRSMLSKPGVAGGGAGLGRGSYSPLAGQDVFSGQTLNPRAGFRPDHSRFAELRGSLAQLRHAS